MLRLATPVCPVIASIGGMNETSISLQYQEPTIQTRETDQTMIANDEGTEHRVSYCGLTCNIYEFRMVQYQSASAILTCPSLSSSGDLHVSLYDVMDGRQTDDHWVDCWCWILIPRFRQGVNAMQLLIDRLKVAEEDQVEIDPSDL